MSSRFQVFVFAFRTPFGAVEQVPNFPVETYERGALLLEVHQPFMSHTVRREIDPLQWAELVDHLGGAMGER